MSQKKTILLVDDDPVVLVIVNEFLQPYYQTRIALRGQKALELARLLPSLDLILLDVDLPDIQGYDLCMELKSNPLTAAIPVIFLSSHSDPDDIARGFELGAVDYLAKPMMPATLLASVHKHFRQHQSGVNAAASSIQ